MQNKTHAIVCGFYLSGFLEVKFWQGVEPVRHLTDVEELHLKTVTERRNVIKIIKWTNFMLLYMWEKG